MRYLTTLLFAALSLNAFSQNNSIHVYPWNPDANQDNSIGMGDMLSFLSVFGEEFGLPPEPCTYDGTALEELVAGITDGTIVLDSVFMECQIEDISNYYLVGCPDPVSDTIIHSHSGMLTTFFENQSSQQWYIHGGGFYFIFYWNTAQGLYNFRLDNNMIASLATDGFFGGQSNSELGWTPIPFSENWYLDENGIHFDEGWNANNWPYYANYLHILPYWHYADE